MRTVDLQVGRSVPTVPGAMRTELWLSVLTRNRGFGHAAAREYTQMLAQARRCLVTQHAGGPGAPAVHASGSVEGHNTHHLLEGACFLLQLDTQVVELEPSSLTAQRAPYAGFEHKQKRWWTTGRLGGATRPPRRCGGGVHHCRPWVAGAAAGRGRRHREGRRAHLPARQAVRARRACPWDLELHWSALVSRMQLEAPSRARPAAAAARGGVQPVTGAAARASTAGSARPACLSPVLRATAKAAAVRPGGPATSKRLGSDGRRRCRRGGTPRQRAWVRVG
jgi:hypothetical protein